MSKLVMVCLLGKYINQDSFAKKYMFSLRRQKLLHPIRVEKGEDDNCWEDIYYLMAGKYLIIDINLDGTKHNCDCKRLKVFSREDYLSDMKEKNPNVDIKEFRELYHYGGWQIEEWEGFIPDWVELPCNCLNHRKRTNEHFYGKESESERQKRLNYRQPIEVENVLGSLLAKDSNERKGKFLIQKNKT